MRPLITVIIICLLLPFTSFSQRQLLDLRIGEGYEGGLLIYGPYKLLDLVFENMQEFETIYEVDYSTGKFEQIDYDKFFERYDELTSVEEWNSSKKYEVDAIVKYEGMLYRAFADNEGEMPAELFSWYEYGDLMDPSAAISRIIIDSKGDYRKAKVYSIGFVFDPFFNGADSLTIAIPFNDFATAIDQYDQVIELPPDLHTWPPSFLQMNVERPGNLIYEDSDYEYEHSDPEYSSVSLKLANGTSGKIELEFYAWDWTNWNNIHSYSMDKLLWTKKSPEIVTISEIIRTGYLDGGRGPSSWIAPDIPFKKYKMPKLSGQYQMEIEEHIPNDFPANKIFNPGENGLNELILHAVIDGQLKSYTREGNSQTTEQFGEPLGFLTEENTPPYDPLIEYFFGEFVNFEGRIYESVADNNLGNNPTQSIDADFYWQEMLNLYVPDDLSITSLVSDYTFNTMGEVLSVNPRLLGIGVTGDYTETGIETILGYVKWEDAVRYFDDPGVPVAVDSTNNKVTRYTTVLADRDFVGFFQNTGQIWQTNSLGKKIDPLPLTEDDFITEYFIEAPVISEPNHLIRQNLGVFEKIFEDVRNGEYSSYEWDFQILIRQTAEEFENGVSFDEVIFNEEDFTEEVNTVQLGAESIKDISILYKIHFDRNLNRTKRVPLGVGVIFELGEIPQYSGLFKYEDIRDKLPVELQEVIENMDLEYSSIYRSNQFRINEN